MDKENLLRKAEDFMRNNIPNARPRETYLRHVFGVRKYAIKLAKIYNADKFIVEMAALLHDVGADAGTVHAHESARISRDFLLKLDIPEGIKEKIIKCIERHSMGSSTETIEERIIQDADGIIFLEDSHKSYFEGRKKKFPLEEAKEKSIEKTRGMMNKIKTKEGIKLAKVFFERALEYIKSA